MKVKVLSDEQFDALDDETKQGMAESYALAEKIYCLIEQEAKEGRVSHLSAWDALLNIFGSLTLSFEDPLAMAEKAATGLVKAVTMNLDARAKAQN